ncbi:MAG: bifunctional oligoribonuclease/PAP phosphatase NrnA [bacterium]|nr:bifunctional oligoribonuclease/PAP phosphatase NrnA [bacterium]
MTRKLDQVVDFIQKNKRFLVASHLNPDGDAIGSTLALAMALMKMGKNVVAYNGNCVPYQYKHLPGADLIVNTIVSESRFDAVFVLDCSEPQRVGPDFKRSLSTKEWINIDHHLSNETFTDLSYIDTTACSTGYLVYNLIKRLPLEIERDIAENIYTTIVTDTGSFRYSNSNIEAFAAASELVALGVSPWDVANKIYESQPIERVKLLSFVLETLEHSTTGAVASIVVTKDMMDRAGIGHEATDGFVNYPRSIEGVEVAFLVREIGEKRYKISYRSKGKVNVAAVAEEFGGGGHRNAAGCVMEGELSDVRNRASEALESQIDAS